MEKEVIKVIGGLGQREQRHGMGFSCFFDSKSHLESRFRSSESVIKRAIRRAGADTNERGLEATRVVGCLCASSHPQETALTMCAIKGRVDKIDSQSM